MDSRSQDMKNLFMYFENKIPLAKEIWDDFPTIVKNQDQYLTMLNGSKNFMEKSINNIINGVKEKNSYEDLEKDLHNIDFIAMFLRGILIKGYKK